MRRKGAKVLAGFLVMKVGGEGPLYLKPEGSETGRNRKGLDMDKPALRHYD